MLLSGQNPEMLKLMTAQANRYPIWLYLQFLLFYLTILRIDMH